MNEARTVPDVPLLSRTRCRLGRVLPLVALAAALVPGAQGQLFDNLEAFTDRIPVGDPFVEAADEVEGPKGIAAADFDGDGRPDLAVSNLDGTVTVLAGTGGGEFAAPVHLQTGAQSLRGIIAADLNGDAWADVATASPYDGAVYLFFNDGRGGFSAARELPAWPGARNLVDGDFDGDGVRDLAVAGPANGLRHYRGTGEGNFEVMADVSSLSPPGYSFPKPVFSLATIRSRDGLRDELVVSHAESDRAWLLATEAPAGEDNLQPGLVQLPSDAAEAGAQVIITEVMADNARTLADGDGDTSDWIELYNPTLETVNLAGWRLQDGNNQWSLPPHELLAGQFLVVFASGKGSGGPAGEIHTGFKISAGGELLRLSRPDGTVVHTLGEPIPQQVEDVSYGLSWDGDLRYFDLPSPGSANHAGVARRSELRRVDVSAVSFFPEDPGPEDPVTVKVRLSADADLAYVWFSNPDGPREPYRSMESHGGGIYAAVIPAGAYRPGDAFQIFVETQDGRTQRLDPTSRSLHGGQTAALRVVGSIPSQPARAMLVAPVTNPAALGEPDLITANRNTGLIEVRRGLSQGARFDHTVWQALQVAGGPRSLQAVDLDGDGWNDLAVALRNFDRVITYRNLSGEGFEPVAEIATGVSPREMAVADFDGDGSDDAAVINRVSSDLSILRTATGAAAFEVLDQIYPTDGEVVGLSVRDINNDGRDDVLQLHRRAGDFSVRLAGPGGRLSDPTFYTMGAVPSAKAVEDVNGDGFHDIVTANLEEPGSVSVRLGTGDGSFGPENRYPLPPDVRGNLFAVAPADFDGDGNLDLALGYFDCRVAFYRGSPLGTFTYTRTDRFTYESRVMTTGDFDLDGDIDLAGAGYRGDVVVFENEGDLLTTSQVRRWDYEAPLPGKFGTREIISADLDDDGDLDLVVGSGDGAMVLYGQAGMRFEFSAELEMLAGARVSGLATADFDGDGRDDLAASCRVLSCIEIRTQVSPGVFAPAISVDVPAGNYLATGDIDGDGQADLIGAGDVLWTALSGSRARQSNPGRRGTDREVLESVVINELLAVNNRIPVTLDGGKRVDWAELYNGTDAAVSLAGWNFELEGNDGSILGRFNFPADANLEPDGHLVVLFSTERRSNYHTGFKLPGEGGTLRLVGPAGVVDSVTYPEQQDNVSYGRFQDGFGTFGFDAIPSPGLGNADNGAVEPVVSFTGYDPDTAPGEPLVLRARGRDDVGIVSISVVYRRRDDAGSETQRLILFDDGANGGDTGWLDGEFTGTLPEGLSADAEIEFYLEVEDLSGVGVTVPSDAVFTAPDEPIGTYSLALSGGPPLEIVRVVADNGSGLQDEAGGTPDYIEVRNPSGATVSLAGVSLTQGFGLGGSEVFTFPSGIDLDPNESVFVFLDANPNQGPLHAPFGINRAGDDLYLFGTAEHGARVLVDTVATPFMATDEALVRLGTTGLFVVERPGATQPDLTQRWEGSAYDRTGMLVDAFVFPTLPGYRYGPVFLPEGGGTVYLPQMEGDGNPLTVIVPGGGGGSFYVNASPPAVEEPVLSDTAVASVTRTTAELAGSVEHIGFGPPAILLFYGRTDGGVDNQDWESSVHLGQHGASFETLLPDLEPGTTYYYRLLGLNESGADWSAMGSFQTLPETYPVVAVGEVEAASAEVATVTGEVLDAGAGTPEMTLFWGVDDGGTNPANWARSFDLGPVTDTVSTTIDGLVPSTSYNYRWRATNAAGEAWSERSGTYVNIGLVELIQRDLRITEIMYNPPGGSEYEYIELQNTGPATLPLAGVRIDGAVRFDIGAGDITSLEPGAHLLLVSRRTAFEQRYGRGFPITGEWHSPFFDGRLSNRGERLVLTVNGAVVDDFTYSDRDGWPRDADGDGSLVLIDPASRPDPADPESWDVSRGPVGSPGISEPAHEPNLYGWLDYHFGDIDPPIPDMWSFTADPDGDGVINQDEYAFGTDPLDPRDGALGQPTSHLVTYAGQRHLAVTHRYRAGAEGFAFYFTEVSDDLVHWERAATEVVSRVPEVGDGVGQVTRRLVEPLGEHRRQFVRVRVFTGRDPTNVPPRAQAEWVDYDLDGRLDILAFDGGNTRLYHNRDDQYFVEMLVGVPDVGNGGADWADFDGDGDPDLALSSLTTQTPTAVFINEGPDRLVELRDTGLPRTRNGDVSWGDFDGDGRPDLLVTGAFLDDRRWVTDAHLYRNLGDGTFAQVEGTGLTGSAHGVCGWIDLDGDGLIEPYAYGVREDNNWGLDLYIATAPGVFEALQTTLPAVANGALDWGDIDGDGDPDLLLSGLLDGAPGTRLFRNAGGGLFLDAGFELGGSSFYDVGLGDHDGDGDTDLLLVGYYSGQSTAPQIWENQGEDGYQFRSLDLVPDGRRVDWGDYDGDGDLDLLLGGPVLRNDGDAGYRPFGDAGHHECPVGFSETPAP